jgi:hypothetical protein
VGVIRDSIVSKELGAYSEEELAAWQLAFKNRGHDEAYWVLENNGIDGEYVTDVMVRLLATIAELSENIKKVTSLSAIRDPESGRATSRNYDLIQDLRARLSGWHFSQEMLSKGEREILYVAEQLMGCLDELAGGYLR